jgi:hypothetical protein
MSDFRGVRRGLLCIGMSPTSTPNMLGTSPPKQRLQEPIEWIIRTVTSEPSAGA